MASLARILLLASAPLALAVDSTKCFNEHMLFHTPSSPSSQASFSTDREQFCLTNGNELTWYETSTQRKVGNYTFAEPPTMPTYSINGFIAVVSGETITVVDTDDHNTNISISLGTTVVGLAFLQNQQTQPPQSALAAALTNGSTVVWDAHSGQFVAQLKGGNSVAVSSNGAYLSVASDESVVMYSVAQWSELTTYTLANVRSTVFSADSAFIFFSTGEGIHTYYTYGGYKNYDLHYIPDASDMHLGVGGSLLSVVYTDDATGESTVELLDQKTYDVLFTACNASFAFFTIAHTTGYCLFKETPTGDFMLFPLFDSTDAPPVWIFGFFVGTTFIRFWRISKWSSPCTLSNMKRNMSVRQSCFWRHFKVALPLYIAKRQLFGTYPPPVHKSAYKSDFWGG